RLSDICRQRKLGTAVAFASHREIAGFPINILQMERTYLSCSETESCQQQQDCVVTPPDGTHPIATGQHSFHVLDRQPLWNQCDRPIRYARYTSRKIRSDEVPIPRIS